MKTTKVIYNLLKYKLLIIPSESPIFGTKIFLARNLERKNQIIGSVFRAKKNNVLKKSKKWKK